MLLGGCIGGLCATCTSSRRSKQGITAPPGDTAYNVSKTGVKVLTEGLQHELRSEEGCKVSAFLLVPGWTISMIRTRAEKRLQVNFLPRLLQKKPSKLE